jgi:hypothetical protein
MRLYFGLKPKNLVYTQQFGLKSARRRFVTVWDERELALRIALFSQTRILPSDVLYVLA